MNSNDQKLLDFFCDIANVSLYQNLDSLSKFYDECLQILKDKTYSNINFQDKEGNTYLHHIAKHGQWNWFMELLRHGADPLICNNEQKTAFQLSRYDTGNIWRMAPLRDVDSFSNRGFIDPTKNFAIKFKEFLFNGQLTSNTQVFENIHSALDFLKMADLDTDINKIKLIAISRFIDINDKIKWYQENYNDIEQNTEFFNKILKVIPFTTDERKIYYSQMSNFLNNNKFKQNTEFNRSAKEILDYVEKNIKLELAKPLIKMLIKQKFNLDVKEEKDKYTLRQLIEGNPLFYSIYLDESLNNDNTTNKKKIKV
jgi:hypothetical protein